MHRARTVLVNLALLVGSTLVVLLLFELAIRIVTPQQLATVNEGLWKPDSVLGWDHQENTDRRVNTGERPARFVVDDRGYRVNSDDEFPTPSNPEYRVLALGDSFLEALMVDSEETAPKVLERLLNEEGITAEVVNTGVSGWNPYHYLLKARQLLEREPFDMGLVFLYAANDVITPRDTLIQPSEIAQRSHLRIPRSISKGEITKAVLQPVNDYLEGRSHLFVLAKNGSQQLLARLGLTKYYFPDLFVRAKADFPGWEFTTAVAERITAEFHRHGVPVAFVLLPASYQVNDKVFQNYVQAFSIPVEEVDLEQPNRILGELFDARVDARLVDVLEPLRQRSSTMGAQYGRIDRHLNEAGHRGVAEALLPLVRSALLSDTAGAHVAQDDVVSVGLP